MSEESLKNIDISEKLNEILNNKELLSQISSLAGSMGQSSIKTENNTPDLNEIISNQEIMSKIPEVINAVKPLVSANNSTSSVSNDKRMALLMALKPYLSPERCEAVDYIAKMSKLSELFKNLNI